MKAIIFTGGPSSGKTSVLEELKKRGHKVSPELARSVIEARLEKKACDRETLLRQLLIFKKQIAEEHKHEKLLGNNELVFFDRSLIDSVVYSHILLGFNIEDFFGLIEPEKYHKVFFFERLEFKKDGIRIESEEEAQLIHDALYNSYKKLGCEVIMVPVIPIEKRADFILERI